MRWLISLERHLGGELFFPPFNQVNIACTSPQSMGNSRSAAENVAPFQSLEQGPVEIVAEFHISPL